MSNFFHVGQKIVCVHTFLEKGYPHETNPVAGQVYTIRDVIPPDVAKQVSVRLEEIVNLPAHYRIADGSSAFVEVCFAAYRFRPVKTTSIEVFKAMLAPKPAKKKERV